MDIGHFSLGSRLWFFRAGDAFTLPAPGTCSKTAKPGSTDTGWIDLGELEDVEVTRDGNEIEIFAATPGQRRRTATLTTKVTMDFIFTMQQLSALATQLIFRSGNLDPADTQFNPLEGIDLMGWMKLQVYDQTDAALWYIDHWVKLAADGPTKLGAADGGLAMVKCKAMGLHSTLNTGWKRAAS